MRLTALLFVSCMLGSLTGAAHAQGQSDIERARTLGRQGIEAFQEKRWDEAYSKLAEAEEIHHAPTLVVFMARAKRGAGELTRARELYMSVVSEELPSDATQPIRDAHSNAARELQALNERIPSLLVLVRGADAATLSVTVDGKPVADPSQPLALDPGEHVVVATGANAEASDAVTLAEGDGVKRLELTLAAEGDGTSGSQGDAPAADGSEGSLIPAFIGFGVGAAGLAMGIATGVMANSKADEVKSRCVDGHCPVEDESLRDDALTLGNLSTAGFVIAGVGVAAGVVLVIVRPGGDSSESAALRFGPGNLQLTGRF
jgi:hypothetical protein